MHENLAKALKARLSELMGRVSEIDGELRKPLSADSEDRATDLENQEALEAIENSEMHEIHQIQEALRRISECTYGICIECGERTGEVEQRKSIRMHFHYALFAEVLRDLAKTVSVMPPADVLHRDALREAAKALYLALDDTIRPSEMTPDEEVRLAHLLE